MQGSMAKVRYITLVGKEALGEDWDITELVPEERGNVLGFVGHLIATASGHWLGAGDRGRINAT